MKKWQNILIPVLVALACSCAGTILGFSVGYEIGDTPDPTATQYQTVEIVAAAQFIPAGTEIQQAMLLHVRIPQEIATEQMIFDDREVVGSFALYDIVQGLPITRIMLSSVAP